MRWCLVYLEVMQVNAKTGPEQASVDAFVTRYFELQCDFDERLISTILLKDEQR